MAQDDVSAQQQDMTMEEQERLEYLAVVQAVALHAVVCFVNLYVKANEKSVPLQSRVEFVEGAGDAAVGPVYDRFHDVDVSST